MATLLHLNQPISSMFIIVIYFNKKDRLENEFSPEESTTFLDKPNTIFWNYA